MIQPDYKTVEKLAEGCGLVPISQEILADTETPVSAYLKIRSRSDYTFLFESVVGGEQIGRYSFLGVDPFLIFRSRGKEISIEDVKTGLFESSRTLMNPIFPFCRVDGFPCWSVTSTEVILNWLNCDFILKKVLSLSVFPSTWVVATTL